MNAYFCIKITKMKRNFLVVVGGIAIASISLLVSCAKPEKVIPGTWTITEAKVDGKDELNVTDSGQDPDCGNTTASVTAKINGGKATFNEDGTYILTRNVSATFTQNSESCPSFTLPISDVDTTKGTWVVVGKDKLILKESGSNEQAECTIVKLKRKKMVLKCPCTQDCQIDLLEDGDVDYVWQETEFVLEKN